MYALPPFLFLDNKSMSKRIVLSDVRSILMSKRIVLSGVPPILHETATEPVGSRRHKKNLL